MSDAIWLLEDDEELLKVYQMFFETKGYTTFTTTNVQGVLKQLDQTKVTDQPALIVADYRLGRETSQNLLVKLKRQWPKTSICCCSGTLTPELRRYFSRFNIDCWDKPVHLSRLVSQYLS